jgi:hypothetical protein
MVRSCITFAGTCVDQLVAIEVLEALRPLGVQAALDALDHSQKQTDEKQRPDQRLWITMQQTAAALGVSEMVVRRLIAQKILPAKQIVKFAPWMIERTHLELTAVRKEIRRVHEGRRSPFIVQSSTQSGLFTDSTQA